ncbi:hypothetical protein ACFLS1_12070 [Verrucomicrobiota bacterium]
MAEKIRGIVLAMATVSVMATLHIVYSFIGRSPDAEEQAALDKALELVSQYAPEDVYNRAKIIRWRVMEVESGESGYWGKRFCFGFRSIGIVEELFDCGSVVPLAAIIVHETVHSLGWQRLFYPLAGWLGESSAYQTESDFLTSYGLTGTADEVHRQDPEIPRDFIRDQVESFDEEKVVNPGDIVKCCG